MLAHRLEQGLACVALQMSHHTLIVTGRIHFASGKSIKPNATSALICVAVTADGSMVDPVQLCILDIKPTLQITYIRANRRAYVVLLGTLVEGWAHIEMSIGSQCYSGIACATVVHIIKCHAVSQQIQLRRHSCQQQSFGLIGQHL